MVFDTSDLIACVATFFAAISAIASWFAVAKEDRHLWRIKRYKRADIILVPTPDYEYVCADDLTGRSNVCGLSGEERDIADDLRNYLSQFIGNKLFDVVIDGKHYFGAHYDFASGNYGRHMLFGWRNKYFYMSYETFQGRLRRYKWHRLQKIHVSKSNSCF